MAAVTSPVDGRAQYSLAAVAMANHSLGRWPFAGVQEIFPGLAWRSRACVHLYLNRGARSQQMICQSGL